MKHIHESDRTEIQKGVCIEELWLDLQDYAADANVYRRQAVRGIVKHGDKYLLIHGKYGDYKFPGGGKKADELPFDTLRREVQEETGYRVKLGSMGGYFLVHEKRKGESEDLLEMDSWYYFCDVEDGIFERNLDDYEKEYEYQAVWLTLPELIEKNKAVTDTRKIPWVVREMMVMERLSYV